LGVAATKQKKRWFKVGLKALALLVGFPLFYVTAGVIGSLISANAAWREAPQGVTIFVRTNGVHTWLMLPKVAEGVDWRPLADPRHIKDPRYAFGDYLAFGFGNRDFYLNTPTWGDLTVQTTLAAAFGRGPALMHVEHEYDPKPTGYQSPIVLTADQYRKLAHHIRESFVLDGNGKPVPLLGRGYGPADVFYEARGSYNMGRTCNEWTGEGLRAAGVKTGIWTPSSRSIMWRLQE